VTWFKLALGAFDSRDCAAAAPAQHVSKTEAHTLHVNQSLDLTTCRPNFDIEALTMLTTSRRVKRQTVIGSRSPGLRWAMVIRFPITLKFEGNGASRCLG
jgi:hypothetical protein